MDIDEGGEIGDDILRLNSVQTHLGDEHANHKSNDDSVMNRYLESNLSVCSH
jgi:hypothetical protein